MEDSFRCLSVCAYFCTMFSGCSMFVRMHHSIKNPSANDPTDSNSWVCRPALHTPKCWLLWWQMTRLVHIESPVSVRTLATTCCEKGGGITCKNLAVLAQVEEGFAMVCPKKQQKLALQTKRLKLFNEGYNVIPPSHVTRVTCGNRVNETNSSLLLGPLSWNSINSLLPQHHDVSKIYAQLSQIKLKFKAQRKIQADGIPDLPMSKNPFAAETLQRKPGKFCTNPGWTSAEKDENTEWCCWKLTKPSFCILFSAYSFWMFLMNAFMCFRLYVLVSIHCLLRCIRIRFGSVE